MTPAPGATPGSPPPRHDHVAGADVVPIDTPHGPARAHLLPPAVEDGCTPAGLAILGHGAGGGVEAPDLQLVGAVLTDLGLVVGLVEQPYRVAGRRAPAPATQVDTAFVAVAAHLRSTHPAGVLITGGRSFGARVACRTAAATHADAVLCLAFPTHPPGRPDRTRQGELDAVTVPTLVVQGRRDPFGAPHPTDVATVLHVTGTHSLATDHDTIAAGVRAWAAARIDAAGT